MARALLPIPRRSPGTRRRHKAMRLKVWALASAGPKWADTACADYLKRLPSHWKTQARVLSPTRRNGNAPPEHWKKSDSDIARKHLGRETLILLDETGRSYDSHAFAARVQHWDETFSDVCLLIGGPDGHDDALRGQAAECVSLSPLTLPHALARVVLLEQLYRASAIIANHPYHRD